jgi:hypothetical protein
MNWKQFLGFKQKPEYRRIIKPQTRDHWDNPFFQGFGGYVPLTVDFKIYDLIREALPICDAAIIKRSRLIGDFRLDGMGNSSVQALLDNFYRNIKVGHFAKGWRSAQNQMTDSVIAKGFSISEMVVDENLTYFDRIKVLRANDFRFAKDKQTGEYKLVQCLESNFVPIQMERQDLIKYLAFDLRDGHPQGVSMLASVPFLALILMRIQTATDNVIWRIGDPTFYAVYIPGDEESPKDGQKAVDGYQKDITESMEARRAGGVKDLGFSTGPGGSFTVRILGGEAKYFDITIPYRSATEQVIARFGLPPFMFGLSWSTSERMAKQQADLLVAEIENDRSTFDSLIEQMIDMYLIVNGKAGAKWKHEWYPINLQDEVQTATARDMNATALTKETDLKFSLRDQGFLKDQDILDYLLETGQIKKETVRVRGREQVLKVAGERYYAQQTERWAKLMQAA